MTTSRSGDPEDGARDEPGLKRPESLSAHPSSDNLTKLSHSMLSRLSRTIETEIVPRLLVTTEHDSTARDARATGKLSSMIDRFVNMLLNDDAHVASRQIASLRRDGYQLPTIYLDLLAPAARRLGEMWDDDECSFADVTLGVCRMHQVLLEFSRCFDAPQDSTPNGRSALIVPTPGEQHTFGLFMVIEFLRRDGWTCWSGTPDSIESLTELVRRQHFDVIGMSISADRHIDTMRDSIAAIKNTVRDGAPFILGGGQAFSDHPDLADKVGIDAVAQDGLDAVRLVRNVGHHRPGAPTA